MTTSLKVIMAAAAVAVLASPVMAQSLIMRAHDPIPEATVTSGSTQVDGTKAQQSSRARGQAAARTDSHKKTN